MVFDDTLCVQDTVILFDSDWNPQNDLQAIDRSVSAIFANSNSFINVSLRLCLCSELIALGRLEQFE